MSYVADESRYDTIAYRRCGHSGLKLSAVSLGLWHNFGGVDVFETAAARLDMNPADLQALMWFREKELWESARFTPIQQKPDLNKLLRERFQLGPQTRADR